MVETVDIFSAGAKLTATQANVSQQPVNLPDALKLRVKLTATTLTVQLKASSTKSQTKW